MTAENNLELEYQKLIPLEKKRQRFIDIALILLAIVIPIYIVMLTYVSQDNYIKNILNGVATAILIFVLIFSKKGSKDKFSQKDRLFFVFYKTHKELLNYIGLRDKNNERKAKMRIKLLSRFLINWSRKRAPPELILISTEIAENLRKKVTPIINHNHVLELSSISDAFLQIASSINESGFNLQNFQRFNSVFSNYKTKQENKIKKFFLGHRYSMHVYIIVIPAIVFGVLTIWYQNQISWLFQFFGFIGFMIAIATLFNKWKDRKI